MITGRTVKHILSNPFYISKIKHKDKLYDGLHKPIIGERVFKQVQDLLKVKDQHNHCATLHKTNDV